MITEKQLRYFTVDFDDRTALPKEGTFERSILEHNANLGMKELANKTLGNKARGRLKAQGIII